ncbi:MAG: MMPL family transporter, partial [Verrucomicrobiota bacterium]
MADDRFSAFFSRLSTHPRRVAIGVAALVLCASGGLFFIPFHHSMEVMLPAGSDAQLATSHLQSLDFSAKVAIAFSQSDNDADRAKLFEAVDCFATSLEPPLVTQVLNSFEQQQMIRDVGALLERVPELFGEADLEQLGEQTTREGVARALRKKYIQLLKPEGSFMAAMVQRDPFDIQTTLIEKIRALSSSFGYDMRIENNHLVSADGRQVLLVLETDVPFTDADGSHALVDYLNRQLESLPPSIKAEMVCGHLHTISNEKVIRRDVGLTVSIASVAFVLLFLFFFRDLRANLIFLIPFAALLVAVNIAALVLGTLSPMMLGFGAVVAGIAVDYGIHVYVAVRRSGSALHAVRAVARPVMLGALTTAGVFAAFFFSSIPGYTQLAFFALFSVLFSVAGALFVLPVFLVPKGGAEALPPLGRIPARRAWVTIAVFALLLAAAIPFALKARFDSDIMRLDGTEKAIIETEERFQETWGDGGAGQAVAVVSASDPESALLLNDKLYESLMEQVGAGKVASLGPIWKSHASRKANAGRWNAFWSRERIANLKELFREEGAQYGFASDAFDPFFQTLPVPSEVEGEAPEVRADGPADNFIFNQLKSRFVAELENETRIFTFFPDEPGSIAALAHLKDEIPGLVLISRSAIASSLARDYTREFTRITLVALGLVLLVAGLLLKSVRKVLIVLAPAVAGVASVAVLAKAVGTDLNVMNLVSGIIVIGLCVDYGIFHVHAYTHGLNLGTRTAITLSAGTTLIGAGALLFTLHPALFSVGLTLVGGISAGYAVSMLVVPALC